MDLNSVFTSYIGRIVTFALTPLLLIAVPPVTNALNEVLGTGFSDQQISNVAIAIVVGIALAVWQWLRNRGNWEAKLAELEALYKSGEQLLNQQEADLAEEPKSSALGVNKGV